MKKLRFSAVYTALLTALLLSGCAQKGTQITVKEARETALEHAGVNPNDVRWDSSELDRDFGRFVYELEFQSGRVEYSYEIDAATGRILKSQKDFDD